MVRQIKLLGLCGVLFFSCMLSGGIVCGDEDVIDSIYTDEIYMIQGELVTIKVYSLTRLSLTNPSVADIVEANTDEILITAQGIGHTILFVWDEHGKRTLRIYVVSQELDFVKSRLAKLLKAAQIKELELDINEKEGKVIIVGDLPEEKREQFIQIIEPFRESILDLVREKEQEDLIQVDMQVAEFSESFTKNTGVDWSTGKQTPSTTNRFTTTIDGALDFTFLEEKPTSNGNVGDLFKIGKFFTADTNALVAQISALLEEGKGRILSKPRIVVKSGEEASFLVGGEIPIRTTTLGDSGKSVENVTFKSYGISLSVTPEVKKDKIDMLMNVEISDIDAGNAVGGNVAFATRSVSTHLYLEDEQTVVLAGLIKHVENQKIKKVPGLGNIPVLGILFRSKTMPTPETDLELVISVTPYILTSNKETVRTKPPLGVEEQKEDVRVQAKVNELAIAHLPGIPKEMTEYVQSLQKKISAAIVYPNEAKEYGWEGTVKLKMLILNDGTLAFAQIKQSSGHEIFDEYALNTARNIAPYSDFPANANLQELNVTIPIVYSLK